MSHASLLRGVWKQYNRLSLAGTSDTAIPFFLNQHKTVKDLVFCLDNDPAGRDAAAAMVRKYNEKGYKTRIKLPKGKDFNEDLLAFLEANTVTGTARAVLRGKGFSVVTEEWGDDHA